MSVTSLFNDFKGFVGKYAGEISSVGTALSSILAHLPLEAQNKQQISDLIEQLSQVPANIEEWLATVQAPTDAPAPVKIDAADVKNAVASYFGSKAGKDAIAAAVAAAVAAATPPAPPVVQSETGTGSASA